jgi:hypothetical protein
MIKVRRETMKKECVAATLAMMMVSVSGLSGCIKAKVETVHEIKPIQITMDINLKVQVDKDLGDFFGDN